MMISGMYIIDSMKMFIAAKFKGAENIADIDKLLRGC
jgi:hypothetical protein